MAKCYAELFPQGPDLETNLAAAIVMQRRSRVRVQSYIFIFLLRIHAQRPKLSAGTVMTIPGIIGSKQLRSFNQKFLWE
ncbi:conserved hypothetical protein [Coccidioides posadasii str. Silveira]|uniref:Uncharacterized protein n=1 Tax=Coccidioides posadasii (strain RMSCC 757 / Silveira) TaxID=443226 RepID=E9DB03_COCPS|nr:conserved hypothetical protein [Coccidioides posadasii str. Silveira]